jgi:hypothetical protein
VEAIPLIIMAAGTALQASSQAQAAGAANAAAQENALNLRQQASEEEACVRRMNRVELARQRASLAKTGVRLEGTPLDQLVRNASELEQNAINARRGLLRAADVEQRYGRSALSSGRTQALASLLAGASNMYGQYQQSSLLRRA